MQQVGDLQQYGGDVQQYGNAQVTGASYNYEYGAVGSSSGANYAESATTYTQPVAGVTSSYQYSASYQLPTTVTTTKTTTNYAYGAY